MSDELEINNLKRYRKVSPRFVLESYDSCEVPAGCGGAILRWVRPEDGVRAGFELCHRGELGGLSVDGEVLERRRHLVLKPGRHVIALDLHSVKDAGLLARLGRIEGLLRLALVNRSRHRGGSVGPRGEIEVLTTADGSWLYTTAPPPDGWRALDFDDSAWRPMIELALKRPGERELGRWTFDSLDKTGAGHLGISEPAEEVWIRKAFEWSAQGEEVQ